MDILEYMERETNRTLTTLMAEYAVSHERVYKLISFLVAGAGAVGSYTITKIADEYPLAEWLPLACIALWWCGIAAWLMWRGVQSTRLGIGATPNILGTSYAKKGGLFNPHPTDSDKLALVNTRLAELSTQQGRIEAYNNACVKRTKALDKAYWAAAASPLPLLIALSRNKTP